MCGHLGTAEEDQTITDSAMGRGVTGATAALASLGTRSRALGPLLDSRGPSHVSGAGQSIRGTRGQSTMTDSQHCSLLRARWGLRPFRVQAGSWEAVKAHASRSGLSVT